MTRVESNVEYYQVGGSLDSNSSSYVTRQADFIFYQSLKAGEFCYVLNSRQMGKSSLRVRTMQKLQAEGTLCIFIDLTGMGTHNLTPEKWYAGIVQSLVSSCQLNEFIQWRTWWRERSDLLSPVQRLNLFVDQILLTAVKQNMVIFVDEIDRVLSQKFPLDDFFTLIRCWFQQRQTNAEYERLTLALLGVANPLDLIEDKVETPFNIGKAIPLEGFKLDEVQSLIEGLRNKVPQPEMVMKQILSWTGGQPFLTQKLCQLVVKYADLEIKSPVQLVNFLVKSRVIENWQAQDEPEHLKTIRDRILRNEKQAVQLLGLYRQILEQGQIEAHGSAEQIQLRLSGLVVKQKGKLKIYNRIYQAIFDQNWVNSKLEQLRPYSESLQGWLASRCQDEYFLLKDRELQNALTWSLGKSLSKEDYRFLVASQKLAQSKTQKLLNATKQASQLLASARQKAKQEIPRNLISHNHVVAITLSVTMMILLLRLSGLFQPLEWGLFDIFFRWRPLESTDTKVVIVTIDEKSLAEVGQWPIPDQILAQAITNIKSQNPRTIALDLYRDLPVEPGHQELVKLFQSIPNLYGIEKVITPRIPPASVLQEQQRVGFVDQVLDADGKIRRALLAIGGTDDELHYSLALIVALDYLNANNISLEDLGKQRIRIGKAIFNRFKANDGAYVNTESGGYQILLNLRSPQENFTTLSLQDVLANRIPPHLMNDRIVFIGTTAESIHDFFYTSYSTGLFKFPTSISGVVLHANITSQILNAALNGRPLIRTLYEPLEWLWILTWSIIAAIVAWRFKSFFTVTIGILFTCLGLFLICYLTFLLGWWLPVIPVIFAIVLISLAIMFFTTKQQDELQFQRTWSLLLEACRKNQVSKMVVIIAIEYLKESESVQHQTFIENALTIEPFNLKE